MNPIIVSTLGQAARSRSTDKIHRIDPRDFDSCYLFNNQHNGRQTATYVRIGNKRPAKYSGLTYTPAQ